MIHVCISNQSRSPHCPGCSVQQSMVLALSTGCILQCLQFSICLATAAHITQSQTGTHGGSVHCLYALQASARGQNSGPRRSARFANQQKNAAGAQQPDNGSSQSSRQPPGSTAQAQRSRSWLQTVTWVAWAVLGLLAAVLAATNPSRADFVESIRQLTSKGLGQWAGQHKRK